MRNRRPRTLAVSPWWPRACLPRACSTAGAYDPTPLTTHRRHRRHHHRDPHPLARAVGHRRGAANCLQSYAPPATLPARATCRRAATWSTIREPRPAHRRRLGRHPAARLPQPGVRADRGLRHRHAAADLAGHLRRPRQDRAQGHHRGPAPARPPGRQRRHRGAQHDDHVRALGGHRLLQRVLPLGPEGAGAAGGDDRERRPDHGHRRPGRQEGLRAQRLDEHGQAADLRGRRGRGGRHAHRVPGAVPAGRPSTRSPATTPCWRAWPPRTRTPRSCRRPRSPPSRTASGVNQDHVDFVRFVNGVLEEMRADGRWTKSYNTWLADALGKAPAPPKPVYGRTS